MKPLIKFIESHDNCRVLRVLDNGQLKVSSLCSFGEGNLHDVIETIPATKSAVLAWLGY